MTFAQTQSGCCIRLYELLLFLNSGASSVSIKSYTDAEGVYDGRNRVQIIVLAGNVQGPFSPLPQCHLPPYGE